METKTTRKSYLRVLAHKFDTWNEARNYIARLAVNERCKVLPNITQYIEGGNGKFVKGWAWTPYINKFGELHFR